MPGPNCVDWDDLPAAELQRRWLALGEWVSKQLMGQLHYPVLWCWPHHPVVADEPQIPEHVLLGRKRPAGGAGGPRRRGVDSFSEAVDARRTERERAGTLEEVPSRRSHHV